MCPQNCSELFNPQEESTFAIDIGCASEISIVHMLVSNCPGSDIGSCMLEEMRGVFTYSSVTYKPEADDLSWNYHGLFVRGTVFTLIFPC